VHDGVSGLVCVDGGFEVGVEDEVKVFGVKLAWYPGLPDPRGVNQDIQPTQGFDGLSKSR
jgi:hypothetical protein